MMRVLLVLLFLICFAPRTAGAGAIRISTGTLSDSLSSTGLVILDVEIQDTGGLPTCRVIGIQRMAFYPCGGGTEVIACIERDFGTTRTLQILDSVPSNTSYRYEAVGYVTPPFSPDPICPPPQRFDHDQFIGEFGYGWPGIPILAYASVGNAPMAHGSLVSPTDACVSFEVQACADQCPRWHGGLSADPEVMQYVDTGMEVMLYGTVEYCCNSCVYQFRVSSATPQGCTVAVEDHTWAKVKKLFR
jgi:hypothetical protein